MKSWELGNVEFMKFCKLILEINSLTFSDLVANHPLLIISRIKRIY